MYNLTAKVRIILDFSKHHPKIALKSVRIQGNFSVRGSESQDSAAGVGGVVVIRCESGVGFSI